MQVPNSDEPTTQQRITIYITNKGGSNNGTLNGSARNITATCTVTFSGNQAYTDPVQMVEIPPVSNYGPRRQVWFGGFMPGQ